MKYTIEDSLLSSISEGDLKSAECLVQSYGLSFINEWIDGYELLCNVLQKNHREVAMLLINSGCICNPLNESHHWTPLHYAVWNNDPEVVNMLLNRSVDVNATNWFVQTPLHLAVEKGYLKIAKQLMDFNADLNIKYTSIYGRNYTIPYLVLQKNDEQIIELFASKNDYNFSNDEVILQSAYDNCNLNVIKKLINFGTDISLLRSDDPSKWYCLIYLALKEKNEELFVTLAKSGNINLNYSDFNNKRPLLVAYQKRDLKMMEQFIYMGADVNDLYSNKAGDHFTLLQLALENNDAEVGEVLLYRDNKIRFQESKDSTVLHLAVEKGYKGIVEKILNQFCPSDFIDENNDLLLESTFQLAQQKNDPEIIKLLEEIKTNRLNYLRNPCNFNQIIRTHFEELVLKFLNDLWADDKDLVNQLLIDSVKNIRLVFIEEAMKCGADINFKDSTGKTCLHAAVEINQLNLLHLVLRCGADIDITNKNGQTALHYAIQLRRDKIICILLDFDADIYKKDNNNCSSADLILDIVMKRTIPIHRELKDIFIKYILKRHFSNLYVDHKLYDIVKSEYESSNFFIRRISNEVASMKNRRIGDSNLTFCNFFCFLNNHHRLFEYIKNPGVEIFLNTFNWDSCFPIYCNIMRNAFIQAKLRGLLLNELYSYSNLPAATVSRILSEHNNKDLRLLIQAHKNNK